MRVEVSDAVLKGTDSSWSLIIHLDRKINAINRTNWVVGYLEKDIGGQVIGVCTPLLDHHLRRCSNVCRWSAKHSDYPSGDPDLRHYVGDLLYKGKWSLSKLAGTPLAHLL